jgi:hypothetical protein
VEIQPAKTEDAGALTETCRRAFDSDSEFGARVMTLSNGTATGSIIDTCSTTRFWQIGRLLEDSS